MKKCLHVWNKCRVMLLLLLAAGIAKAQIRHEIDSLFGIYHNAKNADSVRLQALDDIAWDYLSVNPDSTIIMSEELLQYARKVKGLKWASKAYNMKGTAYFNKSDYPHALENYQQSLQVREELKDRYGVAVVLGNIGNVYQAIHDDKKTLDYELRSLHIMQEIKNKVGIARALGNIGLVYYSAKDYPKALDYQQQSLTLMKEIGDREGEAVCLIDISSIQEHNKQYEEAITSLQQALQIAREINNDRILSACLQGIANNYYSQQKFDLAIEYLKKSNEVAREVGELSFQKNLHETLYRIYKKKHDPVKALEEYEQYVILKDSIFKGDYQKDIAQKELQFEYARKATADSVKHANEKQIRDAEFSRQEAMLRQEETLRYVLYGGLALIAVFALFMFNRFKITQKQKHIIEVQKHMVDEKQKEIVDSINYAKRIQYALLANEEMMNRYLPEHFVFFKPKDIVSGDFYWATAQENAFYLACCDSTGHGVPGAFMSLLNIGFLSEAVNEKNIDKPNEAFNYVRRRLISSISKEEQKDGFDGILLKMKKQEGAWNITYAASNNAPVLVSGGAIRSLDVDKMPVGKGERMNDFNLFELPVRTGDMLYLYTDGYADQFGGEKGKKFKYKALHELLLQISTEPVHVQKQRLADAFDAWKGSLEQVDDVLVIGLRIT